MENKIGKIEFKICMKVEGFQLSYERRDEKKESRYLKDFDLEVGFEANDISIIASTEAIKETIKFMNDKIENI